MRKKMNGEQQEGSVTRSVRRVRVPIPRTRTLPRRDEGSPAARTPLRAAEGSPATEMISAEGVLNEKGLEDFMKLHDCGVSYAVVAIMGPQSSGKSTLLNHLFYTNFSQMDASKGRGKTTNGIWIAKALNMDSCIMVMDVEGTDGQERGQDGTTFEKRSTLLSLVVADIFFINIWCHDIGRENAANRPLLKTIFEVMMQIFAIRRRKATLHFIIRDKTRSPIEALQIKLKTDIQKIWEIVPKTEDFKDTSLCEFFNVEVDALSHYELARHQFKKEVIQLRMRILNSIREAVDKGVVIPTSGFSLHVKKLWETIKENKELDLPTHKKMVATVLCEEIAKEKLKLLASDKEWLEVEAAAKKGFVPGFGAKICLIWSRYLSQYDSESKYFQEDVRNAKRQNLESNAFDLVHPAYINTLNHLRAEVLIKFEAGLEQLLSGGGGYAESAVATCRQSCENEFDKRCLDAAANAIGDQALWDASFVRKELVRDIKNHALVVRTDKLSQAVEKCQERLATKVTEHLNDLFSPMDGECLIWPRIRSFLKRESELAASDLCSDIASLELDQATVEQKVHDLKQYARKLVVNKFKEEKEFVLQHMNDSHILSLAKQEEPFPRCLKVLSAMAVICLDETSREGEVERALFSALIDGDEAVSLDSDTWEEVPPEMTLITPVICKDIWKQFQLDLRTSINPINIADQKALCLEMISGDGGINEKGLEDFMKLHECGVSYAVVAIMGPQSSGKSTLLNHLFHTNFSQMNASNGRGKTTNGIWIAKAPNVHSPCIMVMDVEGTDGQERGQDGTTFEKHSTLFSLVVADIFFINIWCHDFGRENAANRPLLKTIFEVMMQIFTIRRRKATLHFIIRDKTRSSIEALQTKLKIDIQKIWEFVPKTEDFKDTSISDFFNVEVDALSHYEHARQQFIEEVIQLRERVLNSIKVAGDRGGIIPTSGLTSHVKKLWETIKENKELDLPTHKEMVATVLCEEIAKEKLMLLASDKEWLEVEAAAKKGFVPGFGAKICLIWSRYLSQYDSESKYFQEDVRNAKRQNLESNAFDLVHPAYVNTLNHLRAEVLIKFEAGLEQLLSGGGGYAESAVATCRQSCEDEFDKRCLDAAANAIEQAVWDASSVRKELVRDIENHALLVRTNKLPKVVEKCRARLATKIRTYLNKLFELRDEDGFTWGRIRSFVKRESELAASALCSDVAPFELDQATVEQKVHDLKQYARELVENKFKTKAESVLQYMKARFMLSCVREEPPYPECLKMLSTMAAIRLDESPSEGEVERVLFSMLIDGAVSLDSDTWEEVPPEMTLITPVKCKEIWKQFQLDVETAIEQTKIAEVHDNFQTIVDSVMSKLPFIIRLGTWLLKDVPFFVSLLRHGKFKPAVLAFRKLMEDGKGLVQNCPVEAKKPVKKGFKKMKTTYGQIVKKMKEALMKFYNFMSALFTPSKHQSQY